MVQNCNKIIDKANFLIKQLSYDFISVQSFYIVHFWNYLLIKYLMQSKLLLKGLFRPLAPHRALPDQMSQPFNKLPWLISSRPQLCVVDCQIVENGIRVTDLWLKFLFDQFPQYFPGQLMTTPILFFPQVIYLYFFYVLVHRIQPPTLKLRILNWLFDPASKINM